MGLALRRPRDRSNCVVRVSRLVLFSAKRSPTTLEEGTIAITSYRPVGTNGSSICLFRIRRITGSRSSLYCPIDICGNYHWQLSDEKESS